MASAPTSPAICIADPDREIFEPIPLEGIVNSA